MQTSLKILLSFLFCFIGIEYVLVLPSLNDYIAVLNGSPSPAYIGIALGALNFAALITNIPFGILVDKIGNVRLVAASLAICAAIGNILYMCIPSVYAVILSRVFSGIASSVEPILYGILSKATTVEERSGVIAQHMLMRELGLIFGPLLNLGFKDIYYEITGTNIVINQYTMPATFLALSWLVLTVMLLLFYKEPEQTKPQVIDKPDIVIRKPSDGFDVGETEAQPMIHEKSSSRRNSKDFGTSQPGVTISYRVTASMRSMENPFTSLTNSQFNISSRETEEPSNSPIKGCNLIVTNVPVESGTIGWNFLLTDQFVIIMMSSFSVMFFESALETILTPVTQKFFNWGPNENSLCYVAIGISALLGYFILMASQKVFKTEDRTLLVLGCGGVICCMASAFFVWPLAYTGQFNGPLLLPIFAAQIGVGVFSLPFLLVPPATLLSKYSPPDRQSTLQSARMSFQKTAMVLGPLWGANTLFNLYYCLTVVLFMVVLVFIFTLLSYSYLTDEKIQFRPKMV